jgi:hypothetical protein
LIYPFQKYVGIEYLENLHNLAEDIKDKFYDVIPNVLQDKQYKKDIYFKQNDLPYYEFINADFLSIDWDDASFVFANSTCFSPELIQSLTKKANELALGAFIVTFTKKLSGLGADWEIKEGFRRLMSWGIATVYIHRRIK